MCLVLPGTGERQKQTVMPGRMDGAYGKTPDFSSGKTHGGTSRPKHETLSVCWVLRVFGN